MPSSHQLGRLQPPAERQIIRAVQFHDDRVVRAHTLASCSVHVEEKTQAVVERASVLVGPAVGVGSEKGADEITVGSVDLHPIETCTLATCCPIGKPIDGLPDLVPGHRPGPHHEVRLEDTGGREVVTSAHGLGKDLATGVIDLHEDL